MKAFPIYQVDVFTTEYFKGNPAGVCILDKQIEPEYMQLIAKEMNLSETAFVLPLHNKSVKEADAFSLRWFTPKVEIPLCGHATLGTSKILFEVIEVNSEQIIFDTKSGSLTAKKYETEIALDMPLDQPIEIKLPAGLLKAMGIKNYENAVIGKNTGKLIIKLKEGKEILDLTPNFELMKKINFEYDIKGIAVTSKGTGKYDFISRYFNPWAGVNEDPVTGSVHTVLASYWGNLLNKNQMRAYQASERGGEILLKIKDENRIELIGEAVIVLKGEIYIPE